MFKPPEMESFSSFALCMWLKPQYSSTASLRYFFEWKDIIGLKVASTYQLRFYAFDSTNVKITTDTALQLADA